MHNLHGEYCLICFEADTIVDLVVFIEVDPSAIRALLAIIAVGCDPLLTFIAFDMCLRLREQLVVDPHITVGSAADKYFLAFILKVEDLAAGWTTEDLELQLSALWIIIPCYASSNIL